jgi:hypothetical protein
MVRSYGIEGRPSRHASWYGRHQHAYFNHLTRQRSVIHRLAVRHVLISSNVGSVGFSSTFGFDYNDADGVSGYDFNSVVLHEITEVMGRSLAVGGTIAGASPSYYAGDPLCSRRPHVLQRWLFLDTAS